MISPIRVVYNIQCQSIPDCYSGLIQTTLENYRQGCTKPIQVTPVNSEDLFSHQRQVFIEAHLPLSDHLLMRKFGNAREQALIAVRVGKLETAERLFKVARIPLKLENLSLEGSLLYKSLLEQAEAYLDCRRGNFDKACNRTTEALEINTVLEEEYGYEFLFLRRIELVYNLVRIDTRRMYFDRALKLACQILSYLDGTSEVLPIPGRWGCEYVANLTRQSPERIAVMFVQVINEVAFVLASRNYQCIQNLFAVVSANLQLQGNDIYHCHPQAYTWLLVKQAFANNDVAMFLERASQFLAKGRTDTPLLWYATVIDLITLCKELDFPDTELFRQEVVKEAASWEYLPQKFSSLLGVCPKTEAA